MEGGNPDAELKDDLQSEQGNDERFDVPTLPFVHAFFPAKSIISRKLFPKSSARLSAKISKSCSKE